jgi:hypothetical protein
MYFSYKGFLFKEFSFELLFIPSKLQSRNKLGLHKEIENDFHLVIV